MLVGREEADYLWLFRKGGYFVKRLLITPIESHLSKAMFQREGSQRGIEFPAVQICSSLRKTFMYITWQWKNSWNVQVNLRCLGELGESGYSVALLRIRVLQKKMRKAHYAVHWVWKFIEIEILKWSIGNKIHVGEKGICGCAPNFCFFLVWMASLNWWKIRTSELKIICFWCESVPAGKLKTLFNMEAKETRLKFKFPEAKVWLHREQTFMVA